MSEENLLEPAHTPRTRVLLKLKRPPPEASDDGLTVLLPVIQGLTEEMRQINPRAHPVRDVVLERWIQTLDGVHKALQSKLGGNGDTACEEGAPTQPPSAGQ